MKLLKPTAEQRLACQMITGEFRVSHPHLFKPQAPPGSDKLKYSIVMLFDKKLDMTGQDLKGEPLTFKKVIARAKKVFIGPKESWPDGIVSPINDGDDPKLADKAGYPGQFYITAKANPDSQPTVLTVDKKLVTDPSVLYPGCYARAFIQTYVHEYMGIVRVLFSLEHVQKIRDGQPFSGRKTAQEVFSPIVPLGSKDDDEDDENVTY